MPPIGRIMSQIRSGYASQYEGGLGIKHAQNKQNRTNKGNNSNRKVLCSSFSPNAILTFTSHHFTLWIIGHYATK